MSGRGWRSRLLAVRRLYAVGQPTRLAALTALLAVAAIVLVARTLTPASVDHIYTVAAVERGLGHNPGVWVGRTVRVRGDVVVLKSVSSRGGGPVGGGYVSLCALRRCALSYPPMPPGARLHAVIVDDGPLLSLPAMQALFMQLNVGRKPSYPVVHLVIEVQPSVTNSALSTLRQVSVIGSLLPAAATVAGHVEGVYRIRILGRGQATCALRGAWCDDALLLGSL